MTAVAASDLLQLAKPRITALVVFTTASGLWLAPHGIPARTVVFTLIGTVLIVAAANVLNMYLERDSDAHMSRTMHRPLPAHRMEPEVALKFGLALAAISVPLLTFAVMRDHARPGPATCFEFCETLAIQGLDHGSALCYVAPST